MRGALYEYQWKFAPRQAAGGGRNSRHLPSPDALAPVVQQTGEALRQRFNRLRYQSEFQSLSRATAAAYIVHALRELDWTPASDEALPIEQLAERLGMAPQYQRWLRFMLKDLTADEIVSREEPRRLWTALWDEFPECQAELMLLRLCGENMPAVLRGEIDPLNLIFPEGALTTAESLLSGFTELPAQQSAGAESARRDGATIAERTGVANPEIGGGTGGMTSFVLPVLPEHCTEYMFTDVSPRFTAHAQHKFARFAFLQSRTLDIERNPLEQGFDPHSFDVIIASDVLHATSDLRQTLERIKQLLGSGGTLVIVELTRPGCS